MRGRHTIRIGSGQAIGRTASVIRGHMGGSLTVRMLFASLLLLCFSASVSVAAPAPKRPNAMEVMRTYMELVVPLLPKPARDALDRIPNESRRLLAIDYYVRRIREIEHGWSWTTDEVREFKRTDEYHVMLQEIANVRENFAAENPGYHLEVNIAARSLGSQLRNWNRVSSVSRAASDFIDSCHTLLADTALFPKQPDSAAMERFILFLDTYSPLEGRVPTVAVPGLSKHGQLSAFDFKVYKGRRMIAGASSATIDSRWESPEWTLKLMFAIFDVSDRFEGPLDLPYEPWHYNYLLSEEFRSNWMNDGGNESDIGRESETSIDEEE